jgi:hypothetical protein
MKRKSILDIDFWQHTHRSTHKRYGNDGLGLAYDVVSLNHLEYSLICKFIKNKKYTKKQLTVKRLSSFPSDLSSLDLRHIDNANGLDYFEYNITECYIGGQADCVTDVVNFIMTLPKYDYTIVVPNMSYNEIRSTCKGYHVNIVRDIRPNQNLSIVRTSSKELHTALLLRG